MTVHTHTHIIIITQYTQEKEKLRQLNNGLTQSKCLSFYSQYESICTILVYTWLVSVCWSLVDGHVKTQRASLLQMKKLY